MVKVTINRRLSMAIATCRLRSLVRLAVNSQTLNKNIRAEQTCDLIDCYISFVNLELSSQVQCALLLVRQKLCSNNKPGRGKMLKYSLLASTFFGALFFAVPVLSQAQQAPRTPQSIPATNVAPDAKDIRETVALLGLQKELTVTGDMLIDSYFVGAETITFAPGARLIFSDKALRTRNTLLVAAQTIVMADPQRPGIITWARGDGPSDPPPQTGQAPSGSHGAQDGEAGTNGIEGAQGNRGNPGRNAPNLSLFVRSFQGAPPTIDLQGQTGGKGGQGQQGGNGGLGHQGSPASSGIVDCKSGAGHGGRGGDAGKGGQGGIGGTGGAGGAVTFISVPDAFPALLTLVRANVGAGEPGRGGEGGNPGAFGQGGAQGAKSLPFCQDEPGRRGANGQEKGKGDMGPGGASGVPGDVFYTTLNPTAFRAIFGIE